MTVAELQQILRRADEGAVLVSPRILERVLREDLALPNTSWKVPHSHSWVCDRQSLFRHAEQIDLELAPGDLLPGTVLLLARPAADELSNLEVPNALLKYWRRLFHARVHLALAGQLSDEAVRARVEAIGPVEFEEVRNVLIEDGHLPEGADDRQAYVELASVYFELRYFAASLLANYFPGIRDFGKLEELLSRDLDAAALFAATRLDGAPDPVTPTDTRSDESQEAYWKLVRGAQRAEDKNNIVGAAILRMRASRIAPAAKTGPTRQEAEANINQLGDRLALALRLTDDELADWARYLTLLLDKADQGVRPAEAKVLQDLQKACLDSEQMIYTIDLVEWALSAGKRPVMQPLPSQRSVRVNNHLRAAIGRLNEVRLSDADRNHLDRLMKAALARSEEALRAKFGPVLRTALEDVGLRPEGAVALAAFEKVVAELIDRISQDGYLTFMELRDTLSRNQLKLADLAEAEDYIKGDPLIRLDRRLAALLAGVYRPSEIYSRWLERGTSVLFGTVWGRALTLYALLPLVASWCVMYLLGLGLHKAFSREGYPAVAEVSEVMMGPLHELEQKGNAIKWRKQADELEAEARSSKLSAKQRAEHQDEAAELRGKAEVVEARPPPPPVGWHLLALLPGAIVVMALLQVPAFRRWCLRVLLVIWSGLYHALVEVPLRLVPLEAIKRVVASWPSQLLLWWVIKPGGIMAVVYLLVPDVYTHWYGWVLMWLAATVVLNSRVGRVTTEATQDGLMQFFAKLREGLLGGLIRFILRVFKLLVEWFEYVLFLIDEWLRFRQGEGRASLVIRTVAGVIWAPVAFFARFYLVVLIEPGINPVKFPISSLAAKFVYPLALVFGFSEALQSGLTPVVGVWIATGFALVTLFFLPDVFGYLVWEMRENWGLYKANRGRHVGAVAVGTHGETVRALLRPGFHSGTVPRVFARLRTAERRASRTRDWYAVRAYRHEVEEIAHALEKFVRREVVALLNNSKTFAGADIDVGHVKLGTNRIRIPLQHGPAGLRPVEIELYYHQGWVVGHLRETGWLEGLGPAQARALAASLAYLYRLSDVELVCEHLRQRLAPAPLSAVQLVPEGLEVRPRPGDQPVRYQLRGELEHPERGRDIGRLVFARAAISWDEWDAAWEKDAEGEGHPGLPGVGELVWPWPLPGPEKAGSDATLVLGAAPAPAAEADPEATLPLGPRPGAADDAARDGGPAPGEPREGPVAQEGAGRPVS